VASRLARLVSSAVLVPALVLGAAGSASAASSPTTNPQAPFLAAHPLTSAAWGAPVLAADGTGIVAAYVSPKADGRHVYVSRWTPGGGWGPATQLFVGGIDSLGGVHVAVVAGRAVVWWFDNVGASVRRMHVSVRDGVGATWTPDHQVFRSNLSTFGTVAVGPAGVTAFYGLAVYGPPSHTVMNAQTWTPSGWGTDQELSATGDYLFDVAAVGDLTIAWWREAASGRVRYSTLSAGSWSAAADLTDPAKNCYPAPYAGSAARYTLITACQDGSPTASTYETNDWTVAGGSAPQSAPVSMPTGQSAESLVVDGTSAAMLTASSGSGGNVSLLRSSAAGSWSAASTVTTSAYSGATVTISGAYAVVTWVQLTTTSPHRTRIMSRVTQFPDATFLAKAVPVTPWAPSVFFTTQASGSNGAVAAWQYTSGGVKYVQAATWTARGGWSQLRLLVPQYKWSLESWVAVAGSNAMVGWASPSADGATAASLRDPRPTGPARVTKSGRTLTCTAPAFSPAPAAVAYRWLVNGKAVYGATSRALRVSGSLLGKPLVCRVTGSTQGFTPHSAYSTATVVR
jgi:hypothetical protein